MRLGVVLLAGMLAGCAAAPQRAPASAQAAASLIQVRNAKGEAVPLYVYGASHGLHRLSSYSVVRWVEPVVHERTQPAGMLGQRDPESLSTARRIVLHANRLDDEDETRRLLGLLVKDARHYIVSFVVADDIEYIALSSRFDGIMQKAKEMGHETGRWLRAGYRLQPESLQYIMVEAIR